MFINARFLFNNIKGFKYIYFFISFFYLFSFLAYLSKYQEENIRKMVESGCKCMPECVEAFGKLQGSSKEFRYVILKFDDKLSKVVLAATGARDATFEDMMAEVPKDEVRFIFYDCHFKNEEGQDRDKVLFVVWSDDDHAPLKQKMLASATSKEVGKKCAKFAQKLEIHEFAELTFDHFVQAFV